MFCLSRNSLLFLVLSASMLVCGTSLAADYYVSATTGSVSGYGTQARPFKSISAALLAAARLYANPLNIRVAAGTYPENITAYDHVNLWGGYDATTWTRDVTANKTVIDGSGRGSCMRFENVMGGTIDGFTITNGVSDYGGGIYCFYSSPRIENNTIIANSTVESGGAGIYCDHSSAIIRNNTICGNSAVGFRYASYGAGIFCQESSPTVQNNVISSNVAGTADYGGYGGGVCFISSSPVLQNNVISDNSANGVATFGGGGGIFCFNSWPTIRNNIICGNSASNVGAGIYCETSSPMILSNVIVNNSAGAGFGGGIACGISSATIQNNTISDNFAAYGGGIRCYRSSPLMVNNLFHENNHYDVYEADADSNPSAYYNEFYGSVPGIWRDEAGASFATVAQVNAFPGSENNISVLPGFGPALSGTSTSITYDASAFQSTLADASAAFVPGELVGRLLNPDTIQYRQFPIVSNTATTITVWGDVTRADVAAAAGQPYRVFDFHLGSGSALIDAGMAVSAAANRDMDGDARPRGVAFDIGADEYIDATTDTDGDGIPDVIDDDDDNDGLPDRVETNTGLYVDSCDTGTNPASGDTDGDSISDGPNDPDGPGPIIAGAGADSGCAQGEGERESEGEGETAEEETLEPGFEPEEGSFEESTPTPTPNQGEDEGEIPAELESEPQPGESEFEGPLPTPPPEPAEGESENDEPALIDEAAEEETPTSREPEQEERIAPEPEQEEPIVPEPEMQSEPGEGEKESESSGSRTPTPSVSNLCPVAGTSAHTALATQLDMLRSWRDTGLLATTLGEKVVAAYYNRR